MIINLTGILQDGTPPKDGVPTSGGTTIEVPLGTDITINVSVLTPAGQRISLAGSSLALTVLKPLRDVKFKKTAVIANNIATFTVAAADSKQCIAGYHVFDVWLTLAGKRNMVVPTSAWIFLPTATPIP